MRAIPLGEGFQAEDPMPISATKSAQEEPAARSLVGESASTKRRMSAGIAPLR